MRTEITPHCKEKRKEKKSEWKLREPTIWEVRERLRAVRKEVKDEKLIYWILSLVLMAFEKIK